MTTTHILRWLRFSYELTRTRCWSRRRVRAESQDDEKTNEMQTSMETLFDRLRSLIDGLHGVLIFSIHSGWQMNLHPERADRSFAVDSKRNRFTLTNEALSNDPDQRVLTIFTHGRDVKVRDHKIVIFVLRETKIKASGLRKKTKWILTRSGTNGRIVWVLWFDEDIVREESSPTLLPSSKVADKSWFVSLFWTRKRKRIREVALSFSSSN